MPGVDREVELGTEYAQHRDVQTAPIGKLFRINNVSLNQIRTVSKHAVACFELIIGQEDQEVDSSGGDHGAIDLFAETDVAVDESATLAHAVDLGFFNVQPGGERDVGQDIRSFQYALPTETGKGYVGYF